MDDDDKVRAEAKALEAEKAAKLDAKRGHFKDAMAQFSKTLNAADFVAAMRLKLALIDEDGVRPDDLDN